MCKLLPVDLNGPTPLNVLHGFTATVNSVSRTIDSKGVSFITCALGPIYRPDLTLASEFEKINDITFKIGFRFPNFAKAQHDLGHVPGNMMIEALTEALLLAVAHQIKDGTFAAGADMEWFHRNFPKFVLKKLNYEHTALLQADQLAELTIVPGKVRDVRGQFSVLRYLVSGFIEGEVTCILRK